MGDRLATIDMGRKLGAVPLLGLGVGGWIPIKHNVAWAEAYLRTKWHLDPSSRLFGHKTWAENWGLCPF